MKGLLIVVLLAFACAVERKSARRGLPEEIVTDVHAVVLKKGADPDRVASSLGFVNLGPVGFLENVYRFKHANEAAHQRRSAAVRLSSHEEVEFEEVQVKRKRFVRAYDSLNDPLWPQSWNLHPGGVGLNVQAVWKNLNITGRGAQVAIVDDGLDFNHQDIRGNYASLGSTDINFHKPDPMPFSFDGHGTSAGGCASAVGNNLQCGVGVAPESKVAGIRLIAEATSDIDEAEGLGYRLDVNHILSSSWGPYDDGMRLEGPGPFLQRAFDQGVQRGRNGKGAIYIWAAGNGRGARDNCNYDGYANSRFTIPVAAVNTGGTPAWYSEPCAANFCTVPSSGGSSGGIRTVDLNGRCSSSFGGTSAAAPQMAGIVALMLEANANLTWRDVMHVIATSAVRDGLQVTTGWTRNGGGFYHNHDHGFGRIDALKTVTAAKNWINVPPSAPTYSTPRVTVQRPVLPNWVSGNVTVTGSGIDFVEHVDVIFQYSSTRGRRGNVEVVVKSPSGTESVLATPHGDPASSYPADGWKFGTVRNWGENADGIWTVSCRDMTGAEGSFNFFQLNINGFKKVATTSATTTKTPTH